MFLERMGSPGAFLSRKSLTAYNCFIMQALLRDIHFGARMLSKNFGFSLAAIFTLALGIGANTAIFTVTNALLLRPFPYRDPEQLVSVDAKDKTKDFGGTLLRYELVRDRNQSFQSVAVWTNDNSNLSGHGDPLQAPMARVSPNFFSVLGVQPQLGRTFTEEEGRPEGKPVVMISEFHVAQPLRRRPQRHRSNDHAGFHAAHHRRRAARQRSVPVRRPDRHLDATLFRVLAHDSAAAADGRRLSQYVWRDCGPEQRWSAPTPSWPCSTSSIGSRTPRRPTPIPPW